MGPTEQAGADRSAAERRYIARNRGASPCTNRGRALQESTRNSAVASLWALTPCPHGEQVHARRMLDRAERLRVGVQVHSHALRVNLSDRQETGLSIRRTWLRTFQGHG